MNRGLFKLMLLAVVTISARAVAADPADAAAVQERLDQLTKQMNAMEAELRDVRAKLQRAEAATQPAAQASRPTSDTGRTVATLPSDPYRKFFEGVDISAWVWLGYQRATHVDPGTAWFGEFEIDITKRFNDRFAASADIEFIDINNDARMQIEQMFATFVLSPDKGTLLTVGKFNAPFGVEPRDFWDRLTCTPSLLFLSKPNDITGVMLTQPLGDSAFTLRTYIAGSFGDHNDFSDTPAFAVTLQYHPSKELNVTLTGWVGRGFKLKDADDEDEYDDWSDASLWPKNAWWGPQYIVKPGGTLVFFDASATWMPRPDLTFGAEVLFGHSSAAGMNFDWWGTLLLANFDIDDHWRVFGAWSYLDDSDWLVTNVTQQRHEISVGFGYRFFRSAEFRAEYRHDFSKGGQDSDTFSADLSFGF